MQASQMPYFCFKKSFSPTKLQNFPQIRKNICIFRKKAVLLHSISAMSADALPLWLSWQSNAFVMRGSPVRVRPVAQKEGRGFLPSSSFICAHCPQDFEPLRGPLNDRGVLGRSEDQLQRTHSYFVCTYTFFTTQWFYFYDLTKFLKEKS